MRKALCNHKTQTICIPTSSSPEFSESLPNPPPLFQHRLPEGEAPPRPAPEWAPEAHGGLLVRESLEHDPVGFIKHNGALANFFAVCKVPGHGRCIRSRTYQQGRSQGSGHPLGFLSSWLLHGSAACATKEQHMRWVPSWEQRRNSRNCVKQEWNYLEFSEKEQATDPGDSEPEQVPSR